jgi:hypothetical protein
MQVNLAAGTNGLGAEERTEKDLAITFVSAGAVRSIGFKLAYDPEHVEILGVKAGADLPDNARVMMTSTGRIEVSADASLVPGSIHLACVSVRYLGASQTAPVALEDVEVNGAAIAGPAIVRISADQLYAPAQVTTSRRASSELAERELAEAAPAGQNQHRRIRLRIDAQDRPAVVPPQSTRERADQVASGSAPIRIAIADCAAAGPSETSAAPSVGSWRIDRSAAPGSAEASGKVRISLDSLMTGEAVRRPARRLH